MELIEYGWLTDAIRAELEGGESDPFDAGDSTIEYRRKDNHLALRDERGRVVAQAGMVVVDAEVAGTRFPVVGFGGVIVHRSHRGRGLAREIMAEALARAATLGPDFALLFALESRAGLYRKLGFAELGAEVLIDQPEGAITMPDLTMWRGLKADVTWPSGQVMIHSFPF
jgi:predicted N-acetyltransferase YhbS